MEIDNLDDIEGSEILYIDNGGSFNVSLLADIIYERIKLNNKEKN